MDVRDADTRRGAVVGDAARSGEDAERVAVAEDVACISTVGGGVEVVGVGRVVRAGLVGAFEVDALVGFVAVAAHGIIDVPDEESGGVEVLVEAGVEPVLDQEVLIAWRSVLPELERGR